MPRPGGQPGRDEPVAGADAGGRAEQQAAGRRAGRRRPGPVRAGEPLPEASADEQAADQRQQPHADAEGVVAVDRLQVLRQDEEQAEESERGDRAGRRAPDEPGSAEQPRSIMGAPCAAPRARRRPAGRRRGQGAEDEGVGPAAGGASITPYTSSTRPAVDRTPPGRSAGRGGGAGLGNEERDRDHRDQGHRHVDQEDRAPPEVLQQLAADDRAERQADAHAHGGMAIALPRSCGAKSTGRTASVIGVRIAAPRPMTARAAMTWPAVAKRPRRRRRRTAPGRRAAACGAEPVAERAHRQQQAGEDEDVRVDEPLQLVGAGVQFGGQRGQGDVEDRGVEADGRTLRTIATSAHQRRGSPSDSNHYLRVTVTW